MDISKTRVATIMQSVFADELGGLALTDDLELLESGIIDSLALTRLAARLEEEIAGLRVADSDITPENFGSVNRAHEYLSRAEM